MAVDAVAEGMLALRAVAARDAGFGGDVFEVALALCVPKTSSTSCDQAIFVDHAADMRLFPDAVLVEIDRLG